MAIEITDKAKCTGCFACFNACPVKCIDMREDACGFKYPKVDLARCVDCGRCVSVCPINGEQVTYNRPESVYASWSRDVETRACSTSGGAFSELAKSVLRRGGCVVGAAYDAQNRICHSIALDEEGLCRIRQSKYAQSDIELIYQEIRKLKKDREVLFCGTPCQVAGLRNYLQDNCENLTTVDFICRGVNSPKAYREWLQEIEEENHAQVNQVWFKYKEDGWHKSPKCTRVGFADGRTRVYRGRENAFMYGYLGPNLYIRPSCGECIFKGKNRASDITLGDFWGLDPQLDEDKGTSLVIVNSEKGKALLQESSDSLFLEKREFAEIMDGNVCFEGSVRINPRSAQFLQELGTKPFSTLVYGYSRKPMIQRIAATVRRIYRNVLKGMK